MCYSINYITQTTTMVYQITRSDRIQCKYRFLKIKDKTFTGKYYFGTMDGAWIYVHNIEGMRFLAKRMKIKIFLRLSNLSGSTFTYDLTTRERKYWVYKSVQLLEIYNTAYKKWQYNESFNALKFIMREMSYIL